MQLPTDYKFVGFLDLRHFPISLQLPCLGTFHCISLLFFFLSTVEKEEIPVSQAHRVLATPTTVTHGGGLSSNSSDSSGFVNCFATDASLLSFKHKGRNDL